MKLLIADDEMQIRTGLAEGVDWAFVGIEQVLVAQNGLEALELCKKHSPELILTDIRMPGLNGLELSKQAFELLPFVEVIIMSGYSDFEFAQTGIEIGVSAYLLKPINIPDLMKTVSIARGRVQEKREQESAVLLVEGQKSEQRLMGICRNGNPFTSTALQEFCSLTRITPDIQVVVAVVSLEVTPDGESYNTESHDTSNGSHDATPHNTAPTYVDLRKTRQNISASIKEACAPLQVVPLFWQGNNLFITWSSKDKTYIDMRTSIAGHLKHLQSHIRSQYGASLSVGVSSIGQVNHIPTLLQEAKQTLGARLYKGVGQVFWYSESAKPEVTTYAVEQGTGKRVLRSFDEEKIAQYIVQIFATLKAHRTQSQDTIRGCCIDIRNMFLEVIEEQGMEKSGYLQHCSYLTSEIPNYLTLRNYERWVHKLCDQVLTRVHARGGGYSRTVVQVMDYIANHYAEKIQVEDLATHVEKSKNYLSHLFKKEVGITIKEYHNHIRVREAKKLIQSTNLTIYQIAEAVGYSDYKYFSCVFKKVVGVSPQQFRRS